MRFLSRAATHAGSVRKHNEDRFVDRPQIGLWAVADGAGGHQNGALASRFVAEALEAVPPGLSGAAKLAEVRRCLQQTNDALRIEAAKLDAQAMIATTVVVLLASNAHFACLWAGDSRAYLLRDGVLTQVTRDHSLVQEMVDAGVITQAEAERHPRANVITRAVGVKDETLLLDKVTGRLLAGDRFLLCSDGVCKTLDNAMIAARLADDTPPEELLQLALARHASDNITAVTIKISDKISEPAASGG
jgi:protein phosphatase/serine/threonine-protein phosphatase Stp1